MTADGNLNRTKSTVVMAVNRFSVTVVRMGSALAMYNYSRP